MMEQCDSSAPYTIQEIKVLVAWTVRNRG